MSRQDLNTILAIVLPILFSAAVGLLVWKIQKRSTEKANALAAAALAKAQEEKEKREALARGHQEVLDRLQDLEAEGSRASYTLAALEKDMLPIAEAMKRKMIEVLTHPSDEFRIPDALLAQVKEIGAPMPPELLPILKERETSDNPHVTEQEKLAAEALPILVRMAELEAKNASGAVITSRQLVTSTAKTPETKKAEEG